MLRRWQSIAAIIGLLYGFAAGPYTHVHQASAADAAAPHGHGSTFVHTHASSHASAFLDDDLAVHIDGASTGTIWSLDTFVFAHAKTTHAPLPAPAACQAIDACMKDVRLVTARLRPPAHGPPPAADSPLRAPPSSRL